MILFLIHKNTRKTSLWRVKQETRLSNQKLYNKTVSGAFTVFVLGNRGYDRINSHSVTSIHSGATLFCLGNYKSTKLKFWPNFISDWSVNLNNSGRKFSKNLLFPFIIFFILILLIHFGKTKWSWAVLRGWTLKGDQTPQEGQIFPRDQTPWKG